MTVLRYVHLSVGEAPPDDLPGPFRALLISKAPAPEEWRRTICEWLVGSGCLAFSAWGLDCELWHDGVDTANLEAFDYGEIPDENFIMTTWHADKPLAEAFWFVEFCAFHPTIELPGVVIVDVSTRERGEETMDAYRQARDAELPED